MSRDASCIAWDGLQQTAITFRTALHQVDSEMRREGVSHVMARNRDQRWLRLVGVGLLLSGLAGCASSASAPAVPAFRVLAVVEPDGTESLDLTGVTGPEVARDVAPAIPSGTPMYLLDSVVVLRATITTAGDAEDVEVLSGPSPELSVAAAESLARWRFRPAERGGRPVPVRAEFQIGLRVR